MDSISDHSLRVGESARLGRKNHLRCEVDCPLGCGQKSTVLWRFLPAKPRFKVRRKFQSSSGSVISGSILKGLCFYKVVTSQESTYEIAKHFSLARRRCHYDFRSVNFFGAGAGLRRRCQQRSCCRRRRSCNPSGELGQLSWTNLGNGVGVGTQCHHCDRCNLAQRDHCIGFAMAHRRQGKWYRNAACARRNIYDGMQPVDAVCVQIPKRTRRTK